MRRIRLKSGDLVEVITGEDKGKSGKIMHIDRKKGLVFVQGVNVRKKHQKANPQNNQPGGIIEREGPIDPSNLKLIK